MELKLKPSQLQIPLNLIPLKAKVKVSYFNLFLTLNPEPEPGVDSSGISQNQPGQKRPQPKEPMHPSFVNSELYQENNAKEEFYSADAEVN